MKSEITVRILEAADHAAWNRVVAESPDGSPYGTPEYLGALAEATGGRFRILAAMRAGQILGGVALYEEGDGARTVVAPRLLLYYNGPILGAHETKYPSERTGRRLQVLGALEEAIRDLGYARCQFRSRSTLDDVRPFLAAGWSVSVSFTYVVGIADLEAAWGRVEQNLRRLVKRCENEGVVFSEDGDFGSFHRLHEQTADRKGADLYLPRSAFEAFVARLRSTGIGRLYHARLPDGRAVASQLVLAGAHPVTHSVAAGTDAEFMRLGASAFLRWKVLEDLSRAGYGANDLTDAALNPVTHFKSQLGGDLAPSFVVTKPETAWVRASRGTERLLRRVRKTLQGAARRAAGGRRG